MILCGNPHAQYAAHKDRIDSAIARVLDGGRYILGEEVLAFEREFADFVGVSEGVGVGSGTDAIHLALRALGIGQGDEVITVAHTAVATVSAIEAAGATPVLVDIEHDYYGLDPKCIESAITEKTRAIIPVHIYGQPADIDAVTSIARRHDLRVVEDCAQAHGARFRGRRVGSYGDVACFSFYPTKNLGAIGDGGMVVTNDPELARRLRLLREYGWEKRYVSLIAGWNSRLDELQAAILRVKLQFLDRDNDRRRQIAALYDELLSGASATLPLKRADAEHVYHLYVVRSSRRDDLSAFLRERGVGALVHYPVPVHCQPAYRGLGRGGLPVTERAAAEVLSLPMYPELTDDEVRTVAGLVCQFSA